MIIKIEIKPSEKGRRFMVKSNKKIAKKAPRGRSRNITFWVLTKLLKWGTVICIWGVVIFSLAGILKTSEVGDKEPEEFAKEIEKELTDAQIIEVGKEIYVWLDKHPELEPQVIPPL